MPESSDDPIEPRHPMSITLRNNTGDFNLHCSKDHSDNRAELHLDADHDHGTLRVRMYNQQADLVLERVVRKLPGTLKFSVPSAGTYAIEVAPLKNGGASRGKNLTWSDWSSMMGGSGPRGGQSGHTMAHAHGVAELKVA